MDLTKIKEALARHEGRGDDAVCTWTSGAAEDRATLVNAVPDLLTEIERLKALARDGWQAAHDAAQDEGDGETMGLAVMRLAEIGGAS